MSSKEKTGIPPPAQGGTAQRRLFKKKRAGAVLTREEVAEIKAGRKALRLRMKAQKIYTKEDFELTAASLGLYFDKRSGGFLLWFMSHWPGMLLAALLTLLLVILIFAGVTKLRGLYTISLADELFKEGFTLCDEVSFRTPTVELIAPAAEDVTCVSIRNIPADLDSIDGSYNAGFFSYTYYIRNEGESTLEVDWELVMNQETKKLSDAVWSAVYVDGKPCVYAAPNSSTGEPEALPPKGDDSRGYRTLPIGADLPEGQTEAVKTVGEVTFLRVIPVNFESAKAITRGRFESVAPGEVHKFTVVLWVEGDDPDADDSKIGGVLGCQMNFTAAD
ncbi:MAG: hypothetical protein K5647_10830 [Clostridiales bacterium]|nr:hypothetical protein [Clostridiales bacterium]